MANGSRLLSPERCEAVFGMLTDAAHALGVRHVEALIGAGSHALTRFANNTIHQNVAEESRLISVRVLEDGRTARASTNRLDPASLREAVADAAALARAQTPDAELPELAAPEDSPVVDRSCHSTAAITPGDRAAVVAEAIDLMRQSALTAAGIYSNEETVFAVLNTNGLEQYHTETLARFSITAMGDGSSGWAKGSACYHEDLNPAGMARVAAAKAANSRDPVELAPGRYTVILEPAAVLDLLGDLFGDFSATAIRDGRSFLAGRDWSDLFGRNITIHDDVYHPSQSGAPFDSEGVTRRRLALVESGSVREIACSRQAARAAGAAPTGHGFPVPNEMGEMPVNIVVQGGHTPLEEMIASTERGILVTRLWYIREVDPYEKIMTGMTRDGTFLVENGSIARGVRNFRFNQGLIELLRNVEALGPAVRAAGEEAFDMVVPAMKVRGFNFTEVTRF